MFCKCFILHVTTVLRLGGTAESDSAHCDRCSEAWSVRLSVCLYVLCHIRAAC